MYEKFNKEIEPNVFTLEEYAGKKDSRFKVNCSHARIREAKELVNAFPYLDMIMAVSVWNCYPTEYWEGPYEHTPGIAHDDIGTYRDTNLWDNADFPSAIEFCVHITNGNIYFAFDTAAQEMYRNYKPVDEDRFFDEYNDINETVEYDTAAFKKCFEILGVDYEEYRKKYRDADHVQDEYNWEAGSMPMSILLNPIREE